MHDEMRVNDWIRLHLTEGGLSFSMEEAEAQADSFDCHRFYELKRNRRIMGTYRYGRLGRKTHKSVESAIKRLQSYLKNGNREDLVDASNLIDIEWANPTVANIHWNATDGGEHTEHI